MKPTGRLQVASTKKAQPDRRKSLVVYWDTCVLLAWLKGEKRPPGDMEGVSAIATQINKGDIALVTSSLTRAEIFQSRLSAAEKTKFQKFLRRSNVYTLPLDDRVAVLVSEIREFYATTDFELLTPDAIHLATAIYYRVDDFQTFDGSDPTKKPRDKTKRRCGLLLLDGSLLANKHDLRIRKPGAMQLDLLASLATNEMLEVGTIPKMGSIDVGQAQKTQPLSAQLPGSGDGHPEGKAGINGKIGEGNSKEGIPEEGIPAKEVITGERPHAAGVKAADLPITPAAPSPTLPPSTSGGGQSAPGSSEAKTSKTPLPSETGPTGGA